MERRMKVQIIKRAAYEQAYGAVVLRGGRMPSEELLNLWRKISECPIDSYVLLEPSKEDEVRDHATAMKWRGRLYSKIKKLYAHLKPNWSVRLYVNREEKHIVAV